MTSRDLILKADGIAKEMGLSQAEWSRKAGLDEVGMCISRTFNRGNCKVSTLVQMLRPLGYELEIKRIDE